MGEGHTPEATAGRGRCTNGKDRGTRAGNYTFD